MIGNRVTHNEQDSDRPLPTRAVALEEVHGSAAPARITAIGEGPDAEQIIALAFEYGVKVREDADLVEILAALDIDSLIPVEVIGPVSRILSYLYATDQKSDCHSPQEGADKLSTGNLD